MQERDMRSWRKTSSTRRRRHGKSRRSNSRAYRLGVGKGARAPCPPHENSDVVLRWWARFALPTLRSSLTGHSVSRDCTALLKRGGRLPRQPRKARKPLAKKKRQRRAIIEYQGQGLSRRDLRASNPACTRSEERR